MSDSSEPADSDAAKERTILTWGECPTCGNGSFEVFVYVMYNSNPAPPGGKRSGVRAYVRCTACSATLWAKGSRWKRMDKVQWLGLVKRDQEAVAELDRRWDQARGTGGPGSAGPTGGA